MADVDGYDGRLNGNGADAANGVGGGDDGDFADWDEAAIEVEVGSLVVDGDVGNGLAMAMEGLLLQLLQLLLQRRRRLRRVALALDPKSTNWAYDRHPTATVRNSLKTYARMSRYLVVFKYLGGCISGTSLL